MEPPFRQWAQALEQGGRAEPTLVIDENALEHNLGLIRTRLARVTRRLVVKSLPSEALLTRLMAALNTRALMCFHRPFLEHLLRGLPQCDILMGKPLPLAAVDAVLTRHGQAAQGVHWLVDSMERLEGLLGLARRQQCRLRIAIEINIGMERGGVQTPAELARLEQHLERSPHGKLTALMGYDAHVAKAPLGRRQRANRRAQQRYQAFVSALSAPEGLIFNGGGSPTVGFHQGMGPVNDVSFGSILMKPTDFDLPDLADFQPALYLGTPVLKALPGVRLPYLGRLPVRRDTLFLYGGRWMARPCWPASMRPSRLYGLSSNQQMMTVARGQVAAEDWVWFRPTQSEAVMTQLGPVSLMGAEGLGKCLAPLCQD